MSNLQYGKKNIFGRYIYGGPTKASTGGGGTGGGGGGEAPGSTDYYVPDIYTVVAYNNDGTKTAIFGAGSGSNNIDRLTFDVGETGCGKLEIIFNKLPDNAELEYKQRVDVHLFGSNQPWYSGYIITHPEYGTTDTSAFKFIGHGYYNKLENVIINKTYNQMEVSQIVIDVVRQVERKIGLTMDVNKIVNTGYVVEKVVFDHVTAKEALKQLSEYAIDYVYGVDEYRQVYFKPRSDKINEQARLWVGVHVDKFEPAVDIEEIVNHAYIKGGSLNENGEQWLGEVEDKASQDKYGIQETVWELPSAYSLADARRYGESQLAKYKEPRRNAKVSGVRLEYPAADGSFSVRRLSTQGRAAITDTSGNIHTYPITKLKYTVSAKDGIKCDLNLGEQPMAIDRYFAEIDRKAKISDQLQQAANRQLKSNK